MTEQVAPIQGVISSQRNDYIFRLQGTIESSDQYQSLLDTLDMAQEGENITIKVNCFGGAAHVMKEILSGMAQTKATLTGEITGVAMSAATFVFLACDNYIVNKGVEFMAHTSTYGTINKEMNVYEHAEHERKVTRQLIEDYYTGFFTEEEIESILKGSDKYLCDEEIHSRLEAYTEYKQNKTEKAQQQAYEEQMSAIFGEPLPKEALEPLDKETLIKVIRGELSEDEEVELFGDYMDGVCVASEDESPTEKEIETAVTHYLLEQVKSITKHDVDVVEESGLKALKILATPSEGHGEILFFEDNYISYYDINTIDELPWDSDEDLERLDYFKIMCEDFGITYRPESCIEDLENFHASVVSYLKSLD